MPILSRPPHQDYPRSLPPPSAIRVAFSTKRCPRIGLSIPKTSTARKPGVGGLMRLGRLAESSNSKRLPTACMLLAWFALLGLTACHQSVKPLDKPLPSRTSRNLIARQGRYALWCRALNGTTGPPSYLARDAGKTGVPELDAKQRADLTRIVRQSHSSTLRFAFLKSVIAADSFIIYDGDGSPCNGGPDFQVYNQDCRTGYDPEDVPYDTIALPYCATRPWEVPKVQKNSSQ